MKIRYIIFFCMLLGICGFSKLHIWRHLNVHSITRPRAVITKNETVTAKIDDKQLLNSSTNWVEQKIRALKTSTLNIDTNILRLSLIAYQKAEAGGLAAKKQLLTVIDYSKPSTMKRLWVFDLQKNKTVFNTWVSHGVNSGGIKATSFSNVVGSLKSSIGVFLTDHTYYGGKGYSLRIKGLEKGFNDNAFRRNVVLHGATYINPVTIKKYGQVGRSWGCPAVSSNLVKPLINTIKDKSLLIVYYPDKNWLKRSRFLAG